MSKQVDEATAAWIKYRDEMIQRLHWPSRQLRKREFIAGWNAARATEETTDARL